MLRVDVRSKPPHAVSADKHRPRLAPPHALSARGASAAVLSASASACPPTPPPRRPGESRTLRVLAVTWNMHAKSPPGDLRALLQPGEFDVVAVGTEECMQSIKRSFVFRSKRAWTRRLAAALGDGYREVASRALVATHLAVFVRAALLPLVTRVETARVATGTGNVVGNKGGVGVGLGVGRTSLLFVNCHLPAHQHRVRERNQSFHRINTKLQLRQAVGAPLAVSDRFDRVFWMGDLNYRVNANRRMADDLLSRGMLNVMRANDQLTRERARGRAFAGFSEGALAFSPTYKLDPGTADRYDSSPKRRVPSWTDRVLYLPAGGAVRLLRYDSLPSFRTSDHLPVVAEFEVDVEVPRGGGPASPAPAPAALRIGRGASAAVLQEPWSPMSAPAGARSHGGAPPHSPMSPMSSGYGTGGGTYSRTSSTSSTSTGSFADDDDAAPDEVDSPASGAARRVRWPPAAPSPSPSRSRSRSSLASPEPADDMVVRTKGESSVCAVM